jgi:protein-disulfide isomerase
VTIVEFSDFECAYCARNHVILNELVERQPYLVRVVYRHFPLDATCNDALEKSVHSRACRAAEAAECAGKQGRFHEMADVLFANQRRLFENNLYELAESVGVDAKEFRRCMDEHAPRADIMADAHEGKRLDIRSTPTLFINGRKVVGTLPDLDRYEHAVLIESRLIQAGQAGTS